MSHGRIVSPEELSSWLDARPGARDGLVLANGVFDLVHVGHVRYLEDARRQGRRLVVAVNSDESARRLKGPGRPLVPLAERMELVAALRCVEWVTPFHEDRLDAILRSVRPSVHAKGTDYTVERVPERALALALGIRTVIVGDEKRHATSDILARIQGGARGEGPRAP